MDYVGQTAAVGDAPGGQPAAIITVVSLQMCLATLSALCVLAIR